MKGTKKPKNPLFLVLCGYEERMKSGGMLLYPNPRHESICVRGLRVKAQRGGFLRAGFCGISAAEVVHRLMNKREIPASFDILEHIFPGFAGGGMSFSLDVGEDLWEDDAPTEGPIPIDPIRTFP